MCQNPETADREIAELVIAIFDAVQRAVDYVAHEEGEACAQKRAAITVVLLGIVSSQGYMNALDLLRHIANHSDNRALSAEIVEYVTEMNVRNRGPAINA